MNWAAVLGLYHFIRGQDGVWSGCEAVAVVPEVKPAYEVVNRHDRDFSDAA